MSDTVTYRQVFTEVMVECWNDGGFDRAMVILIALSSAALVGWTSYMVIAWLIS